MTCFNPKYAQYEYMPIPRYTINKETKIKEYIKDKKGNPITKIGKKIKFTTKENFKKNELENLGKGNIIIPCGKCIGCRLDKAKSWGIRGLLESRHWNNNCFITLTYNDKWLPKDHNLHKKEVQNFLKRLRKEYTGIQSRIWKNKIEYPIRYFYSGEYGSAEYTMRPHFHIGIFNWQPTDKKFWKYNDSGDPIYLSEQVSKLWSNPKDNNDRKGFITVEDMNFTVAQYIGRYTAKKCFGKQDEIIKAKGLKPEFIETSRRGGLGYQSWENIKERENMKRNYGFWYKDKKGNLKLGKIPNFIKEKWKKENTSEFAGDDYGQYFTETDKHAKQCQENIQEHLNATNMTIEQYLQLQKQSLIDKLRNAKSLRRNRITTQQ